MEGLDDFLGLEYCMIWRLRHTLVRHISTRRIGPPDTTSLEGTETHLPVRQEVQYCNRFVNVYDTHISRKQALDLWRGDNFT